MTSEPLVTKYVTAHHRTHCETSEWNRELDEIHCESPFPQSEGCKHQIAGHDFREYPTEGQEADGIDDSADGRQQKETWSSAHA